MKTVCESQIFAEEKYGGISSYFYALATQRCRFPSVKARIVASLYVIGYLKQVGNDIAVGRYVRRLPKTGRIITTISDLLSNAVISMMQPDVVHEPYCPSALETEAVFHISQRGAT